MDERHTMARKWSQMISISVLAILAPTCLAGAQSMDDLMAAAKSEGQLTVIALPHDWCGYGAVIEAFKAKYGLAVNELNPNASSGDEVEAIRANKGSKGPKAPDVIDVGLSYGDLAKKEGLIQPYKVVPWDSIPDNTKDADGYWYGDYYGVVSLEVNTDVVKKVPTDWADLQAPDYKHSIALAGDPRSSNQGIQAVFAAGLSTSGGKIDQASDAGLQFFAALNKAGNLLPTIGKTASLARGTTPIILRWDYNALADRDNLKGNTNVEVVVPKTGVVAGFYIQAISAFAPHPNAAKLWMEYLYSLDGQYGLLKGYCHPIRYNDLLLSDMISDEMNAALPPDQNYVNAVFPTIDQQTHAKDVITKQWDSVVGANVK